MSEPHELVQAYFNKPTGATHISHQFSLTEHKLLNALIWNAQRKGGDLSSAEIEMPTNEVFQVLGWHGSNNTDDLKAAVRSLVGTTIEWNEFGVDRSQSWSVCTFLSSGKLRSGKLRYRLNPEIVEQINRPTLFAKMQLLIQNNFGSKRYPLKIYEFLLDHVCRAQRKRLRIADVPLDGFFGYLGIEGRTYTSEDGFKNFNRRILKPALKDINDRSDLEVMCKYIRQSRRVVALTFDINRKDSFQLEFPLDEALPARIEPAAGADDELLGQLMDHGVTQRIARELCQKYSRERIEGNIVHMRAEIQGGKPIRQRGAWLRRAIEEDFRPKVTVAEVEEETRRDDEKRARVEAKQTLEARTELEKEFSEFRYTEAFKQFAIMPETWKTAKLADFEKRLRSNEFPPTWRRGWKDEGMAYLPMRSVFLSELLNELLHEEFQKDLQSFVDYKGRKRRAA